MFLHKDGSVKLGDMVIKFFINNKRMCQKLLKKDYFIHKQEPLIMQGNFFKFSPEVWKD